MYPYLSDYLKLTDSTGCETVVFDGCRTAANAAEPGRADKTWERQESNLWPGCCCWTHQAETYETSLNPDPWYDPANPATLEVAGAIIDPPDGAGNGFYLEPSTSARVLADPGFVPLEMFATFTVVASTARGERAYIDWLTSTLSACHTRCDGFKAEVITYCPCADDHPDAVVTDGQISQLPPYPDGDKPEPPEDPCGQTPRLQPFTGLVEPVTDRGFRTIHNVRFTGIQHLNDGPLFECSGNRWQVTFEVDARENYGESRLVGEINADGWDTCVCLCDSIELCEPTEQTTICGPAPLENEMPIQAPTRRVQSGETFDGFVCVPGRWARPDQFMLQTLLTPPLAQSVDHRLDVTVSNGSEDIYNARLLVWEALDHAADPATNLGWQFYQKQTPVWEQRIIRLRPFETLHRKPDCSTTVRCVNGETHNGAGTVESPDCCENLSCERRYWIGLALTCDPLGHGNLDLAATIKLTPVTAI